MTFQAIINGARGLVYFGGNVRACWNDHDTAYGWNWTFYDRVLRPVLDELQPAGPLYPALIAPESRIPLKKEDHHGIEYTVRESGDFLYVLAAKREGDTVEAVFSGLPDVAGGEVLFENLRPIQVDHGRFTDWFGPNEVHVYRFRRRQTR
jgi:hypothetical protein